MPLIVGVWYGPWAGLVTGAVGYPLTVIVTLSHSGGNAVLQTSFPPAYSVSDGLVGLTGGLLLLYVRSSRPKPSLEKIVICCGIAAIAVVISALLANKILAQQGHSLSSATVFKGIVSDTLCDVVLLTLALYFRPSSALTYPSEPNRPIANGGAGA